MAPALRLSPIVLQLALPEHLGLALSFHLAGRREADVVPASAPPIQACALSSESLRLTKGSNALDGLGHRPNLRTIVRQVRVLEGSPRGGARVR